MKIIHQMKLKGPWEYQWKLPELQEDDLGVAPEGRIKVPVVWQQLFGAQPGRVVWSRRFQKPTNLDATERVMISATGLAGIGEVRVNSAPLPMENQPEVGFRFDITEALKPTQNLLEIEMECETEQQTAKWGMTEPAVIEIWSLTG